MLYFFQTLLPQILKDCLERGQVGWGKEECKPPFWPPHVPFENLKTRPSVYAFGSEWRMALVEVMTALYEHFGYDPKIWTKETVSAYDTILVGT